MTFGLYAADERAEHCPEQPISAKTPLGALMYALLRSGDCRRAHFVSMILSAGTCALEMRMQVALHNQLLWGILGRG